MNIKHRHLTLTVVIFSIIACTSEKETTKPKVMSISESVYSTGYIKSKNQYEVFGQANGIIEKIFISEGVEIKQGDPVFKIMNTNLKLATENARLASSAADYAKNQDKLIDAGKSIELAKKDLLYDSLQFNRQKNLWEKNIGSRVELEQKELKFEKSKAALKKAKTNYQDLAKEIKLASEQSKNNLIIAQKKEEDFIVRSEVDGRVYKINKKEGELNNGLDPIAIIGTNEFVIELTIDEKDIIKVKKGQQVIVRMDSYNAEVFDAHIIAIEPIMNLRTRSFQVEAIFREKPPALYPNLTVEANIVIQKKENALTIPRNYLTNGSYVQLKGGQLQSVETGIMDYDLVEITAGIDEATIIELPEK